MKKKRRVIGYILAATLIGTAAFFVIPTFLHNHSGEDTLYTCPMHPQIVQDHPGDCPICGMRLVPLRKDEKKRDGDTKGEAGLAGLGEVSIDPEKQALMGLTFEKAVKRALIKEIRIPARILPDETRQYKVTMKVNGWVEHLFVNQTGQYVRKGAPLLSIYSPELLSAQQEYISALNAARKLSAQSDAGGLTASSLNEIVQAARERLHLFDISSDQVARLEKTGIVERTMVIHSPASGYVQEKKVFPGQKVMVNDDLMTIIDLSRVWGESDIYEVDIPYVKIGMTVEVTLPYWPGKTFRGKITFLDPFLNPDTRTIKARLEIPNSDLTLRPNMYGDAKILFNAGMKIAVSEGAVMRTGLKDYVFVKKNEGGNIVPVEVKLGMRSSDGYFEIRSGLVGGESVVSTANFLVDSESSIRAAIKSSSEGHKH